MSAQIIDGKSIAAEIKEEAKRETEALLKQGVRPCLAVVLVGDDPASKVYIKNKEKACEYVGIKSATFRLPKDTTEAQLLELIEQLNDSREIHGILVQLPLPEHIDQEKVIYAIQPEKDVDCFHPHNVGLLQTGADGFVPCTPAGIMALIRKTGMQISGKECVVIGRSNIVGKPIAILLLRENGTVTICHSKTENLKDICLKADLLVVATGNINTLTADMVKPGAVVIDVGMNRDENGRLVGDVDFSGVSAVCGAITPVPGGVGPMTIAMLMKSVVKAAHMQNGAF